MIKEIDCKDFLTELANDVKDNSIDIQTIFTYLIEETDFVEWLDEYKTQLGKCDCSNCDCCGECEESEVSLPFLMLKEEYDIQSEQIKKLNGELVALQKKYKNIEKKYRELKSSK